MPPRHTKLVRGPILPPRQVMNLRALGLALLAHLILVLMLVLGLDWKTEAKGPLQVMLVAEGNSPVNPPPHAARRQIDRKEKHGCRHSPLRADRKCACGSARGFSITTESEKRVEQ